MERVSGGVRVTVCECVELRVTVIDRVDVTVPVGVRKLDRVLELDLVGVRVIEGDRELERVALDDDVALGVDGVIVPVRDALVDDTTDKYKSTVTTRKATLHTYIRLLLEDTANITARQSCSNTEYNAVEMSVLKKPRSPASLVQYANPQRRSVATIRPVLNYATLQSKLNLSYQTLNPLRTRRRAYPRGTTRRHIPF